MAGATADGGNVGYAASKGGLDALMKVVALDWGPDEIRINNVYLGVIDTLVYWRLGDDAALVHFAAITLLRSTGQPAHVGDFAVWLSGEEARFVTGQSLMVDGGLTLASA